jgi:hypothetical protein
MAKSDHRLCDVCGRETFYDCHLNYGTRPRGEKGPATSENDPLDYHTLDCLGNWAVLCTNCAKTHRAIIVPRDPAEALPGEQT